MPVFQILLIVSEDAEIQDSRIVNIIRNIQKEIPSQVISLRQSDTPEAQNITQRMLHPSFETTTLFITIQSIQKNLQNFQTTTIIDILIQLSTLKTRPKCLMITLSERGNLNYRELFQIMWSNYFLDVTIFEITEKEVENNGLYWNHDQNITLYYFNPFSGVYTKQKYTERTKLFPNKLKDLHRFEMQVGSFHFPPHVYVKRNSSGYPVEVSGPDALVAKAISRKMNFRLSELPSREERFGNIHCDNQSRRTGFAYLFGNNTIRFITNHGGAMSDCKRQFFSSKSTGLVQICVLIPIIPVKIYSSSLTMKWIYLVLLVIIIRIISILLKFDNNVWPWFEILRGTLGFTVPREPSRLSERIAFVAILMAFSIFSSNIFAMLTDMKLKENSEMTIDTLEELNKTNLIPTMTKNVLYAMRSQNEPVYQALINKSTIVLGYKQCIDLLVQGKNVSCILRESMALFAIRIHKEENNGPVMKIVKERIFCLQKVIRFEPNSPFIRQVDAIISRLIESGLIHHWEERFLPTEKKSNQWKTEEKLESVSVLIPLIFFITFGCCLSIVVFLCELLIKYIDNRIYGCVLFISQGSVF